MTETELQAIEGRIEAAIPGPWRGNVFRDGVGGVWCGTEPGGANVFTSPNLDPDDADLIAHAPSDLAALVGEVRTLRAALEEIVALTKPLEESEEPMAYEDVLGIARAVLSDSP